MRRKNNFTDQTVAHALLRAASRLRTPDVAPQFLPGGENGLSHSPACTIAGQAKACPTAEESQHAWVGHALACPATFGLTTNSTTSGVRSLVSTRQATVPAPRRRHRQCEAIFAWLLTCEITHSPPIVAELSGFLRVITVRSLIMSASAGSRAAVDTIVATIAGGLVLLVFYPLTLCAAGVKSAVRMVRPRLVSGRGGHSITQH